MIYGPLILDGTGSAMVIDSHLHLNFRKLGVREIISYMDREGIDMCWLLTWEEKAPQTTDYVSLPVQGVFEAYQRHPSRIVPMYAPDPGAPDAVERLMSWAGKGIRGCGELKVPLRWDSPELDPLLSCLDRLGFPLVFHMEQGGPRYRPVTGSALELEFARFMNSPRVGAPLKKFMEGMAGLCGPLREKREAMRFSFPGYLLDFASLENRLKEYPDIRFIGHGPMFWNGVLSGVASRFFSQYDNMYADLSAHSGFSALVRDPGFAKRFLSEYSHKVLYGTDNFFIGLRPFLDSLRLSRQAYRRIYGENAMGLAGQCVPSHAAMLAS